MTDAMPWNIKRSPKALVSFSIPSKSTKTTEVSPTYAPDMEPNTAA